MSAAASAIATAADVNVILEQIKSLNTIDLLKVASAATTLAAKNVKKGTLKNPLSPSKKGKRGAKKPNATLKGSDSDATDASTKSKRGAQLDKPRAWVKYVATDASTNGWPSFPANVTAKDKLTGLKATTVVEMPASEERNGKHVFPDGKTFNHKHAMSLSKAYWVAKTQSGDRKDLYHAFEGIYVPPAGHIVEAEAEAESDD